ncbi:hypothetical protein KY285_004337 [Solanum tuberosum]|nr:hypothetical protein KY284_003884 [Solanum tuberosum]KAH0768466.1 hypothetical protein KY285_004337 [Solanum tuberosum]
MDAHHELDAILENIINEHKNNGELGGEGLVATLLRLMKEGGFQFPITNDNIKAIIFDMFGAGTETSSTTIDWTMVEMMRNPNVLSKAQAEVRNMFRESFKPERFEHNSMDFVGNNFEYLPFGSGRRNCPGISFGLANVYFPLAQLLYHFDWKLPSGIKPSDLDLTESAGVTCARKSNLYLIAAPHQPRRQE